MNEEINIEQQLQAELSRLKKAIEYIEQAEKYVQQCQQLNKENQSKCEEVLNSNENLKSDINAQTSITNKKIEKIINDLDKLSKIVATQNKTIEQNQKEIDRLKNKKWYQKLFG